MEQVLILISWDLPGNPRDLSKKMVQEKLNKRLLNKSASFPILVPFKVQSDD